MVCISRLDGYSLLSDDARQLAIDPGRDEGGDRAGQQIGAAGIKTELTRHDGGPARQAAIVIDGPIAPGAAKAGDGEAPSLQK